MRLFPTRPVLPVALLPALVAALALGACGDDAPAPEPGFVTVALQSPSGAEGGALFRVEGEVVTRADTDEGMLFLRQAEEGTRVVVVRGAPGAVRFRMEVENVHQPPTVQVEQVSGPDDVLRPGLAGYSAEVAR